jgi:hypothetical protein
MVEEGDSRAGILVRAVAVVLAPGIHGELASRRRRIRCGNISGPFLHRSQIGWTDVLLGDDLPTKFECW